MVSAVSAQVLEKDEAALVYYSPKTVVVVDFCYTVETQEKGLYAEFAEAMLGTVVRSLSAWQAEISMHVRI